MYLRYLMATVAVVATLAAVPFFTLPSDAAAPQRISPYVDWGKQSLTDHLDWLRFIPHHLRFVEARCSGSAVAMLYELRTYPFLTTQGAFVVNGDWPPPDPYSFGGGIGIEDFNTDPELVLWRGMGTESCTSGDVRFHRQPEQLVSISLAR